MIEIISVLYILLPLAYIPRPASLTHWRALKMLHESCQLPTYFRCLIAIFGGFSPAGESNLSSSPRALLPFPCEPSLQCDSHVEDALIRKNRPLQQRWSLEELLIHSLVWHLAGSIHLANFPPHLVAPTVHLPSPFVSRRSLAWQKNSLRDNVIAGIKGSLGQSLDHLKPSVPYCRRRRRSERLTSARP